MKIMVYPRPRGFLMPSKLFFFGPTILKIRLTIFIQQKLCKRFFSFVKSYLCLIKMVWIPFLFCISSI